MGKVTHVRFLHSTNRIKITLILIACVTITLAAFWYVRTKATGQICTFNQHAILRAEGREHAEDFYAIDAQHVYYEGRILPDASTSSFHIIGGSFVFGADTPKDGGYAHDNKTLYYAGNKVDGADVSSFELTHRIGYARDKNAQYAFGAKIKNDFVMCGSALSLLPEGESFWQSKMAVLNNGEEVTSAHSFVEFCTLKDGSKLIGFVPSVVQGGEHFNGTTGSAVKHYYLFDQKNMLINPKPAVLDCSMGSNPGLSLPRSLDVLDGNRVKLQCAWTGACDGRDIYQLNIDDIPRGSQPIVPTHELYDCGYRG